MKQPNRTRTLFFLRFNGHFPGEPGLAGVYWSKGWWKRWWQLDYWSYKSCKVPVKSSPTNQHPVFYRPDVLPVAQPTVSKHWRENITFHGLAYPKLTWGLPTLSLATNSSWLPWAGLPCLSSALWCQYSRNPNPTFTEFQPNDPISVVLKTRTELNPYHERTRTEQEA